MEKLGSVISVYVGIYVLVERHVYAYKVAQLVDPRNANMLDIGSLFLSKRDGRYPFEGFRCSASRSVLSLC